MFSPILAGFLFFGLFSPGPNVILLTASGARFGFRATVPHVFGVTLGAGVIAGVTGLGVGTVLAAQPQLTFVLKIIACCWMLWMARGLWVSEPGSQKAGARPFTFLEAVLFQWVNPKIWAVSLSASVYVSHLSPLQQATALGLTVIAINFFVCLFWSGMGQMLSYLMKTPQAWRLFNRIMAASLAVFAGLVFL